MGSAAEFDRVSKFHDTDLVPVFFSEQGDGPHRIRLLHRCFSGLLQQVIGTDESVYKVLHLPQFFVGDFGEVREVEAKIVGTDIGTLLFDMGAEHAPEREVHQVRGGVVVGDLQSPLRIYPEDEGLGTVGRNLLGDVDRQVVLLHGVENIDLLAALGKNVAGVSDLPAHFRVERCAVENQLKQRLVLLLHGAVLQKTRAFDLRPIIAEKRLFFSFSADHPVAEFVGRRVAGSVFLFLQFGVEALHVHGETILAGD